MKCLAITVGLLLVGRISTTSSVIFGSNCIRFEESYTFSEDRFVGKWYEIRQMYNPKDDNGEHVAEHCIQEMYTRSSNMMDFDIVRSVQLNASSDPAYSTGIASPRVFANAVVPQFYLRYNTTSPADPDTPIDIVNTDYLNYAIVYSCTRLNYTTVTESAWVLARRPAVTKHAADLINKFVATSFDRPGHKWRVVEQADEFCKPTNITSGVAPGSAVLPVLVLVPVLYHLLA